MSLTPPLKWHGGKQYLADWILSHAPSRVKNPNAPAPDDPGYCHYVEPFAGGLQVLFANDPEGISEVVADMHGELTNFWAMLQNADTFAAMQRQLEATPFSESEFQNAGEPFDPNSDYVGYGGRSVARAVVFFIRVRQSLAARQKGFATLVKTRCRRGMQDHVSAWLGAIDGLPAVHARLRRVVILNRDALEVIRQQDGPRTWFYCDPPYLHETRATTGEYAHEMSKAQHAALLNVLGGIKGRFALSGYPSGLYESAALRNGWRRVEKEIPNQAAGGKTKRKMTECLWLNY